MNYSTRHLLLLIAAVTLLPGFAWAADRGMQFIGASRTTPADIEIASRLYREAGGSTQFSFLPFEFNPQAPFTNATRFVQQTVPGLSGSLTVTCYVSWWPHDPQGRGEQLAFWKAWQNPNPSFAQRALRNGYLDRLRLVDEWIKDMNRWARANGIASRLDFVVAPVLEDTCPESLRGGYERLVTTTRSVQQSDRVTRTTLRRSCLNENVFRVDNVALELHGPWQDVRGQLRAGDTWSNDGTRYDGTPDDNGRVHTEQDFLAAEGQAIDRGISVLLWRDAYNGFPKGGSYGRNWARRTVTPFTDAGGRGEVRALSRVLSQR